MLLLTAQTENDNSGGADTKRDPAKVQKEKEEQMAQQMAKLEEEANKGNRSAILEVGNNYFYGRGGLKQDYKTAVSWYKKGAELTPFLLL